MTCCTAVLAVCLILVRLTAALQACTNSDGPGVCRCSGTTVGCGNKNLATVPDNIPASTTYLSIGRNQIVTIENGKFQHLNKLTTLILNNNKINMILSQTFAGLQNLKWLYLHYNNISVVEPGSFQHLQKLTDLHLHHNKLTTLPNDAFATLYNLTKLYLYNNQITALDRGIFSGLNQLSTLNIYNNQITALDRDIFSGLNQLSTIYFSNNQITALDRDIFSGLNQLSTIYFSYNQITALDRDIFSGLNQLSTLTFSYNQITALDRDIFSGLNQLSTLTFSNNQITALERDIFSGLNQLSTLTFSNNQIAALDRDIFSGLNQLSSLSISNNHITALDRDIFSGLNQLLSLSCSNNQITVLDCDIFTGLNQLRFLYLSNNSMTVIPNSVANLTSLQSFSMAHNEITALQPGMFSNRNVGSLDLDFSYNNITIIEEGTFSNITTTYFRGIRIILRGNPIKIIDMYSFSDIGTNYRYGDINIDLSNMQLEIIHEEAFSNVANNVEYCFFDCGLDLRNNQLESLPPNLCDLAYDLRFSLSNNPWSCDCRMEKILGCSNLNYGITCQSPPVLNNTILQSLTRDNLTCSSPAITHTSPAVHQAAVGEIVILYCNSTGFNRPSITWSWTPVQPNSAQTYRPHYDVSTTKLDYNSVESTLTINRVQMSYQGHYTCHAANAAGDDLRSFSLFVIPTQTETPSSNTGTPTIPSSSPHFVVSINNKDSTHSSVTLIGATVGSFVGGILLCAVIGLIVYMCKRKQTSTSSSQEAEHEQTDSKRGTERPNPAFEQDADEYEDIPQREAVYQNQLREPVTFFGGQDGRPGMVRASPVAAGDQRQQLGDPTVPGTSTSHLYQGLQQVKQDHVYTSLQREHVS
ncbi:uncharacterized protein LOC144919581 [Branchiostoma floridae x Branchiostoma belcheri]